MLERIFQIAATVVLAAACIVGGVRWYGQRRPAEALTLQSAASEAVDPQSRVELRYSYQPDTAAAQAFTVTSSDMLAAAVDEIHAEAGVLTVFVTTGSSGSTEILVSSGDCAGTPVHLTLPEQAEEEEAEPPRVLAPDGMAYITPSGTRWHLEKDCAGETAALTARSEVGKRTPCQRCAQEDGTVDAAAEEARTARENALPGQVFVTPNGTRWHLDAKCGGKYAYPVDKAETGGRLPCQRCAPEEAAAVPVPEGEVYVTPSGSRWHLDADCAGETAARVSPSEIDGRTPCKKCAQEYLPD